MQVMLVKLVVVNTCIERACTPHLSNASNVSKVSSSKYLY